MAERDDTDWFEALAGRAPPRGADPAAATEAGAVRAALRARVEQTSLPEHDSEAGVERLLFRLRQERLLDAKPPRPRWQTYAGAALAASLALVVGLLVMQPGIGPEDPGRSRGGAVQTLTSPEPDKLGDAIVKSLESVGLKPRLIQFGDTVTIESDWPERPGAQHAAALARHGLQPPEGMGLRIEIRKPGGTSR